MSIELNNLYICYTVLCWYKIKLQVYLICEFFSGELIEDINLKKIEFLSKDLIKLGNLYDKKKLLSWNHYRVV